MARFQGLDYGREVLEDIGSRILPFLEQAAFVRALQRLMPAITEDDLVPGGPVCEPKPWMCTEISWTTSILHTRMGWFMSATYPWKIHCPDARAAGVALGRFSIAAAAMSKSNKELQ